MSRPEGGEAAVERVLAAAFEAAVDGSAWPAALALAGDLVGGTGGHLLVWDRKAGASPFSAVGGRMPPEGEAQYAAYYGRIDPRLDLVLGLPTGAAIACHEHFDNAFVRRNEFYNDFLLRHGRRYLAACRLDGASAEVAILGLHRAPTQEPFGPDELALLARLAPQLGRAARVERALRRARREAAVARAALDALADAILVVDGRGRVLALNAAAGACMEAGDPVRLRDGRLGARDPGEDALLRRLVAAAAAPAGARGGAAHLTRADGGEGGGGGGGALVALVAPLAAGSPLGGDAGGDPAALVILSDPAAAPSPSLGRTLVQAFGLTPAEARLTAALAAGRSLKEAAALRRVTHETARTQLRAVLAKTGARGQADLARLVAGLPALAARAGDDEKVMEW